MLLCIHMSCCENVFDLGNNTEKYYRLGKMGCFCLCFLNAINHIYTAVNRLTPSLPISYQTVIFRKFKQYCRIFSDSHEFSYCNR